jgi:hypothetical protein
MRISTAGIFTFQMREAQSSLAYDIFGFLVHSQTDEARMAQVKIGGPLDKLELTRGVAADDEFLAMVNAHLLPHDRPLSGFVFAVALLGDQPLEALFFDGRDKVSQLRLKLGRIADRVL